MGAAICPGDVVVSPMRGAHTAVSASRSNGIAETPILVAR
jgi:diaminopimelate decarboxylase